MSSSNPTFGEPAAALAEFWKMPAAPKLDLRKREWIYFLQSAADPHLIKIGRTRNLKWRILGIQTQCPVALKLLKAVSAPAGTEGVFHAKFDACRAHGEWFEPTAELLRFIESVPAPLTLVSVRSLAAEIDCDPFFLRAMERPTPNGRTKTLRIPTGDSKFKDFARRIAKSDKPQNVRAMVANLKKRQAAALEISEDWRTDMP